MTVRVSKPEFNLREKLSELDKPTGVKGLDLMGSETSQDARDFISAGRKNLIINGGMRIHQRGTASYTLNSGNTNEFIVDRFRAFSGAGTIVASQDTTVPDGQGFAKSIKLDCTVADASTETEGYIEYRPEAQDFYHLAYGTSGAKTITISFFVKSSYAATYGFYYYIPDAGPRAYQTTFAISSANTWEKKTITIPGDIGGSGFSNDNGVGAEIRIIFNGTSGQRGSSNQNSWSTNTSNRLPTGTNLLSSTSNDFFLTGFQIEVGRNATEFEHRSFTEELLLCQRYYEAVYMTDGTAMFKSYASYGGSANFEMQFKVDKRATPTWSLEGNAAWSGATPNAFESRSGAIFQHNAGTQFALGDAHDDLCGSFSCEL